MEINWKRIRCQLLHTGEWRRWVKHIQGDKRRVVKCMKCDEEWEVDRRSSRVYPLAPNEHPRLQDLYTNERSEFWDQIYEIERLRKEGVL